MIRGLVLTNGMLGIAACAMGASAQASPECPLASSRDAGRVQGILQTPQEFRTEFGLDSARADDVAPLTDPSDASACKELRAALERDRSGLIPDSTRIAFFRSGPLYFVTYSPPLPAGPVFDGDAGMVLVFGREFDLRVRLR